MKPSEISLRDLQNPRRKESRPGEKNYNPTGYNGRRRCQIAGCEGFITESKMKSNIRIIDDMPILLCDECLLKYDQKQEGKK